MGDDDWEGAQAVITVFLNGEGIAESDPRGQRVVDDSFLLILNAHHEDVEVTLPGAGHPHRWRTVVDTVSGEVTLVAARGPAHAAVSALESASDDRVGGDTVTMTARSMLLLQRTDAGD